MLSAAADEAAVSSSRTRFTVFRLQSSSPSIFLAGQRTGMLKANAACSGCAGVPESLPALRPTASEKPPTTGLLQAISQLDAALNRRIRGKPGPAKAASTAYQCNKGLTENPNDCGWGGPSGSAPDRDGTPPPGPFVRAARGQVS